MVFSGPGSSVPVRDATPVPCLTSGLAALQDYAKLKLLVKEMIELKDRPELEEVTDRLVSCVLALQSPLLRGLASG